MTTPRANRHGRRHHEGAAVTTDLDARMGALIDGATYDWTAGPDAMRWTPHGLAAIQPPVLDLERLRERLAAFWARMMEAAQNMARAVGAAFARVDWSAFGRLAKALERAVTRRSPARYARRHTERTAAEARTVRVERRARRAELRRTTRRTA